MTITHALIAATVCHAARIARGVARQLAKGLVRSTAGACGARRRAACGRGRSSKIEVDDALAPRRLQSRSLARPAEPSDRSARLRGSEQAALRVRRRAARCSGGSVARLGREIDPPQSGQRRAVTVAPLAPKSVQTKIHTATRSTRSRGHPGRCRPPRLRTRASGAKASGSRAVPAGRNSCGGSTV
jgi:hypothetical protein